MGPTEGGVEVVSDLAEEVIDDDYAFDPLGGPPEPTWKAWGPAERDAFEREVSSTLVARQEKIKPTYLLGHIRRLMAGRNRGYLIAEGTSGVGKTLTARTILRQADELSGNPLRVFGRFQSEVRAAADGELFLESLNRSAHSPLVPRAHRVSPLEPQTLKELTVAVGEGDRDGRFREYLADLARLNRSWIMLVLDGIDERVANYLSPSLPEGVFVVILVDPQELSPSVKARLEGLASEETQKFDIDPQSTNYTVLLEEAFNSHKATASLDAAARQQVVAKAHGKLVYVMTMADLLANGYTVDTLPEGDAVYPAVLSTLAKMGGKQEEYLALYLSLALARGAVSLDDLDQWGASPTAFTQAVKSFPSTFYADTTGLCPALGLAHETFAGFLRRQYPGQTSRLCKMLAGWAVHSLLTANEARLKSAQTREWARFNFIRLFDWSLQSGDKDVLEWVVRCKDLQKKRISISGTLEGASLFHQKIQILNLWETSLMTLVESHGAKDLRDEWAWALSSRALTFLKLGDHHRALADIQKAVELFDTLVEREGQGEFRNGLAAAHNRRSEIYRQLNDYQNALLDARRAVEIYTDLVEDHGREDLRYLLGMAFHNRAVIYRMLKNPAEARKDCEKAADVSQRLMDAEGGDTHKQRLAAVCNTWGLVNLSLDDYNGAISQSGKAVQLYNDLVEQGGRKDLKNELASAHNNRGSAYHRLGEFERAGRDYGKTISLRNLLIDEGRLDLRDDLAQTYTNRAIVQDSLGQPHEVIRDYTKAIELRKQLVEEEGKVAQKFDLAQNYLYRGLASKAAADLETAGRDFDQSARLFTDFYKANGEAARELALAFNNKTSVHLALGQSTEAAQTSQVLISLLGNAQEVPAEAMASAYRNQGQSLRSMGNFASAEQSYSEAVNLLTRLIEQENRIDLLGELAVSLQSRAAVSLASGNVDTAIADCAKSIEALTVLIEKAQRRDLFPELGSAYGLRAQAYNEAERYNEALEDLTHAFKLFGFLSEQGIETIDEDYARAFRQRAVARLRTGDPQGALHDTNEAIRLFLATRQRNQRGPWLQELARTWTVRGGIFYILKDFGQAENQLNDAVEQFQNMVAEGRFEFFSDLANALYQRAQNAQRSAKIDKVLEEFSRIINLAQQTMARSPEADLHQVVASTLIRRAKVYQEQGMFQEAYQDFENALTVFRKLVGEEERYELAPQLASAFLSRARLLDSAGHPEPAINDYTEALNICRALVSQGNSSLTNTMATSLKERAQANKATGRIPQAAEDIGGAINLQMQLARTAPTPELFAELGSSLLIQGNLYQGAGQVNEAAQSYDKGIQLYTSLVEGQGKKEYSGELAQCLMARTSLAGGGAARDPHTLNVLTKAVQLVTQQARDGMPVPRGFPLDCLQSVVELVNNQGSEAAPELVDSVLRLLEVVVANSKSAGQDFVKMTDLLLAASAGLADDRRSSRRAHFLSLACVSCNREIQVFGKNSLPRLVYCLYELGQALERSKPPEALAYVGGSFGLLLELIGRYQGSEDFKRELKMMVSTWRSLPPAVPALANVSRHTLSQLLKIT
ncbi:MAG: tetratricopeptide repeat protein [Candidatus Eremiobacteraeota bacterium]|nr:tetratricopeptide repeat protein [Candidatus Eremiobacteraeota bacterium]